MIVKSKDAKINAISKGLNAEKAIKQNVKRNIKSFYAFNKIQ